MNASILKLLQEQLTIERTNSAIYCAAAYELDAMNWAGSAKWMKHASVEEQEHADIVANYIIDIGRVPEMGAISPVSAINGELPAYFESVLERERMNTARLTILYTEAVKANDPQTVSLLLNPNGDFPGFLAEQTKSEREISDILIELRRLDKTGWKLVDQELGKE